MKTLKKGIGGTDKILMIVIFILWLSISERIYANEPFSNVTALNKT